MSKKITPNNGHKGPQIIKDPDGTNPRMITTTGAVLWLHPPPSEILYAVDESAEAEWREKRGGEPPTPPTYSVELGGETLRYAHDEKSILEIPKDKPAWDKWLKDKAIFDGIRNSIQARVVFLNGVEIKEERKDWERELKTKGLSRVPESGIARHMMYVKTNLPGKDEARYLIGEIMKLVGVSQEELDKAEAQFRAEVDESQRPDAEGVTDTA